MIWEGWAAVYLFLEMLEFWRILSLKIFKMLHDEFLNDESLNSYHSHIYMLARLRSTHLLFTAYEHGVWSSCVDPWELVMWLNQDSLARSLTHATSTPEVPSTYIHPFPSPESPKNILLLIWERINKNISVFPLWNKCSSYLVTTTCYIISRDECL